MRRAPLRPDRPDRARCASSPASRSAAVRGRRPVAGRAPARGGRSGSVGDAAATSFYPGKNLGAYGDAGAVTDRRRRRWPTAARAAQPRQRAASTTTTVLGFNCRLDTLQAVVLRAKLARLETWNDSGVRPPPATTSCSATSAGRAPARPPPRATSTSGTSTSCAATAATGCWPPCGGRHRHRRPLPDPDPPLAPSPTSAAAATSRWPRRRRGDPVAPLFPGITDAQQERVARAVRGVLDGAGQDRTRGAREKAGQESAA